MYRRNTYESTSCGTGKIRVLPSVLKDERRNKGGKGGEEKELELCVDTMNMELDDEFDFSGNDGWKSCGIDRPVPL